MASVPENTLCYGDCLDWMQRWDDASVDLIYLDPPFKSDANYNVLYAPDTAGGAQTRAFADTWSWDAAAGERLERYLGATARSAREAIVGLSKILGPSGMLAYLTYMAERLEHMHRLLKPTGSLYLHCDPTASHYLKVLLDAVFSPKNFRNEIIWRRSGSHNKLSLQYGPIHDVILFYTRGPRFTFDPGRTPYTKAYLKDAFRHEDERGRYQSNNPTGPGTRDGKSGEPWRGYDPTTKGRHWAIPRALREALPPEQQELGTHELLDIFNASGDLLISSSGAVRYKQRAGAGVLYQDIWAYQPGTKGVLAQGDEEIDQDVKWLDGETERLGYPTQKPRGLLERIIRTSTKPGDLVLDPFCGCGTTVDAARRLERRWCGIDISAFAVDLIKDRRLADPTIPTLGIPADLKGARKLAAEEPFAFESWAVTRLPGFAPNTRQRGDGGIDGRATLALAPDDMDSRLALAQVKGGKFSVSYLRDFRHVIDREEAALGCFVTLDPAPSRHRADAKTAGQLHVSGHPYDRLHLWSIADYFDRRWPVLPIMTDPYTGRPIQQRELF